VGIRPNFWKKAAARATMFAKSVEVRICKNYFQDFPLDRATILRHGAMKPVQLERVESDRKDFL